MDFNKTMAIAAAGMQAQGARLKVLAENVANADSLATTPDGEPYRRRIPAFRAELDREMDVPLVRMYRTVPDRSDFGLRHDPSHPAADENGYVKTPNVNSLIESIDMRTAQQSYEANLNVVEAARTMMMRTIDLLQR